MSGFIYSFHHNIDLENVYEIGANTRTTGFLINNVDIGKRYKARSYGYNKYINLLESSNANDSIFTYNSVNINNFFQLKDSNFFNLTNGTRIANTNHNYVYKFLVNGSIRFNNNTRVYIEAIGGGGGGGSGNNSHSNPFDGAGGGAGGRWYGYIYCLANHNYTINIGEGGDSWPDISRPGNNTTFHDPFYSVSLFAYGGGESRNKYGKSGGCGGGGCGWKGSASGGHSTGAGSMARNYQTINFIDAFHPVKVESANQDGRHNAAWSGNNGGAGINASGGGGDGGIGEVGSQSSNTTGGTGGSGLSIFGEMVGGGGGGGGGGGRSDRGGISGVGGNGGGGRGEANQEWALQGTDGTGGGGGGCSNNGNVGGRGGRGVLWIAF